MEPGHAGTPDRGLASFRLARRRDRRVLLTRRWMPQRIAAAQTMFASAYRRGMGQLLTVAAKRSVSCRTHFQPLEWASTGGCGAP